MTIGYIEGNYSLLNSAQCIEDSLFVVNSKENSPLSVLQYFMYLPKRHFIFFFIHVIVTKKIRNDIH